MTRIYKIPVKLSGYGEAQRCFYPFKIDPYGRGCTHNCLYCYARSVNEFRGQWDAGDPAIAKMEEIRKPFYRVMRKRGLGGRISMAIRARVPVRLGGFTDCFCEAEKKWRQTRNLIGWLNDIDYPYLIMTKSETVLDCADILRKDLAYIQFSVTTPHKDIAAVYEPGASSTEGRLDALRQLAEAGFHTAARINPLFPTHKDGHFSRGASSGEFRYFGWDLVDMIAEAKADTLIAGFLRLSTWNLGWIKDATGEDLRWLFTEPSYNVAFHFSPEEKRVYYERMKARTDDLGLSFSVCYDGDEDYETFRYLWANHDDCCNGLGKVAKFERTFEVVRPMFP